MGLDDLESTCIMGRMEKNTTFEEDCSISFWITIIIGGAILIFTILAGPA